MADYFDTGFCVRERSWHGKETLVQEHPESWDEARRLAGLLWEPKLTPLYKRVIELRPATDTEILDPECEHLLSQRDGQWMIECASFVEASNVKMVQRDDTHADLGAVSGTFELISHGEMGQIVEAVLQQPNVKIDTMLSMKGGAQVAATILLDEPYAIGGDVDGFGDQVLTLPYFVILNSHNGTGACKGLFTQVRVVCANTYQAADMDGNRHGAQFNLRHTSGVKGRIEEAAEILKNARAEALRWKSMAEQLVAITITDEQQMQFLDEFIPEPPAGITSERVKANIARDRGRFLHVLNNSATNMAMAHTGLGLVNAAVEYLDHVRGFRDQDTYLGRQILKAEPLKAKAVQLVRDLAAASN